MPRTATRRPTLLQALRRRAGRRLRVAVLLLFALGVAAQSMLGVLGELHEMTVHAGTTHGLADHLAPHDHEAAVQDGTDVLEGGPLHLLLHYTHCCSHSTWMAGGAAAFVVVAVAAADTPADSTRQVSAPDLTTPFRPPIAV